MSAGSEAAPSVGDFTAREGRTVERRSAAAGETDLLISRIFDAPREIVFEAWSDPKHLGQWWGPHGMTTPLVEIDLRVGGSFCTVLRDPDGNEHPTRGVYREVVAPQRLVFDIAPLDPRGNAIIDMTVTLIFEDLVKRTRLTARVAHKTPADRQLHEAMGFYDGWGQTWERLETHLATM